MKRRELLVGAGLALAAITQAKADKPVTKPAASAGGGLTVATAQCTRVAQACLRHCLAMLATGNPSMAGCAKAVADLIPAASALGAVAAGGSRHVAPLAKVVGEIAKDCKAECDKHPAMAPCKECGESCAALIAEIAKI